MLTQNILINDMFLQNVGTPFAVGDVVGPNAGVGQGIVITPAAQVLDGGGTIQSLLVVDRRKIGVPLDVFFFSGDFNGPASNAPFVLDDYNAQWCLGMCQVGTYVSYGPEGYWGFATFPYGAIPYKCKPGTRQISMVMVTRGAPTYFDDTFRFNVGLFLD